MFEVLNDMFGGYLAATAFVIVILIFGVIISLAVRALRKFYEESIVTDTNGFKEAYMANTIRKKLPGSRYVIKCKNGKWSVDGKDEIEVMRESVAVFLPYFNSGDYEGAPEAPTED